MAHILLKKIFEPFLVESRLLTKAFHYRPPPEPKKQNPPVTIFGSVKKVPCVTRFEGHQSLENTPEAFGSRSFSKKAPMPASRISVISKTTITPGGYFPSNWRWYTEHKDSKTTLVRDVYIRPRQSFKDDSLSKRNMARLDELKKKLKDSSMLKGTPPEK